MLAVVTMILLVSGMACKKEQAKRAESPPISPAQVEAKLHAADAHDGTTDQTIGDCLMCGLRMSGKPEIASVHHGYTLHFCSTACKDHFKKAPDASIAALETD